MLPLAGFGIVVLLVTGIGTDTTVSRVLLLAITVAVAFAVLLAAAIAADLGAPLRAIASSVDRVVVGRPRHAARAARATTSSAASPTATTGSRATSSGGTRSCA